ncbi:right-handed parallel beta-helix repeat-containing protein [Tichowtungia aerotolerans]|uniref:Right handed beta helix domain-containing protein n=1 Tax=Tichowtungia aerotolerans TaxID=2697043 RepID=A0A6P1M9R5_9BACT|nr:right-handed parallel beta-helix repeat-containing protein [Tichowtungia aerotolerans]QHI70782.1 hypothetical protein GT409_15485 [Tichowtungia aerotolerans]
MKRFWFSGLALAASCLQAVAAEPIPSEQFYVQDFGSDPAVAVTSALAAAQTFGGTAEILFEPGTVYRMGLPDGEGMQSKYAVHIRNATNLVLNGQGATLLITHPEIGAICTEDCQNIEIKNFKIDYDPLPYAQGRIHAVSLSENWFDLKVDEGFLEPDHPCFDRAMAKWGLAIRDAADGGRQYGPGALFSEKWERTGDRIWRFYAKESRYDASLERAGLKFGERYIHMARNYAQAVAAKKCDEVLWENITIYASPGLAFYPHQTSHHTIRNCHVKVKEDRIFSTDADGIHMRGSRGHVLIDGCTFEGMADDGINVHSSAMSVQSQPASNQVLVKKHTYSVRPGDRVVAVDSASAGIIGTAAIQKVEDRGRNWLLSMDREFAPFNTEGAAGVNEHGDPIVAVNFYNLSESADQFMIRNCEFRDYRGRGILVSAHGGLIENNTFRVREGWGIVMNYETSRWAEGPIAHDVVIRNNRFFAKSASRQPAIQSRIHTRAGVQVDGNPVRNISIENNRFYGYQFPAIRMEYTEGLELKNNEEISAAE